MSELTKSQQIDALIDELFSEDVEKSMIKDAPPQKETADEALKDKDVKWEDDDKRKDAGRPRQISDVPKVDTDGKRANDYDSQVAAKNEDAKKKEDDQVAPPKEMKKGFLDEEYKEYQALKKAQAEQKHLEELRKAREDQSDLIKSAVLEATSEIRNENLQLRKAMEEQSDLIKAMANKPQRKRSITNMTALEKSHGGGVPSDAPSAQEMKAIALDVGESLVKSKRLTVEHVVELENTGYIFDPEARQILEGEIRKEINKRYR